MTASARASESADRAAAQIAALEDKLERESSEKRELQNQVSKCVLPRTFSGQPMLECSMALPLMVKEPTDLILTVKPACGGGFVIGR